MRQARSFSTPTKIPKSKFFSFWKSRDAIQFSIMLIKSFFDLFDRTIYIWFVKGERFWAKKRVNLSYPFYTASPRRINESQSFGLPRGHTFFVGKGPKPITFMTRFLNVWMYDIDGPHQNRRKQIELFFLDFL